MSHTTNKQKKTNKKASTEHVKPGYVTHNKQKTNKKPQQNMLNQLMSHTTNKQNKKTKKGKQKFNRPQQNKIRLCHTQQTKNNKTCLKEHA